MIAEQQLINSISSKVIALIDSNVKSGRHSIESVLDFKFWGNITRKMLDIIYELDNSAKDLKFGAKVYKKIIEHICETYMHRDSDLAVEFLRDFAYVESLESEFNIINFTKTWLYGKGIYHHDFVVHLSSFIK